MPMYHMVVLCKVGKRIVNLLGANMSRLGRALVPKTLAHNASMVVRRLEWMSMLRKVCVCEKCCSVSI